MKGIFGLVVAAVVTFFVTLLLNKFLSAFRYRQLYATMYDYVEDVYSGGRMGRSLTVIIGNKGKDREENIELHFLEAGFIKLISSDSLGCMISGGSIKVDRLVPGEKIRACIFLEGAQSKFTKKNIKLRSAEANGSVFFNHGREPVGLGPIFLSISLFSVIFGWIFYGISAGLGPDYLFSHARYWSFYESGFKVRSYTGSRLLDGISPFAKEYPIQYRDGWAEEDTVILVFDVVNTASVPIMVETETVIEVEEYKQRSDNVYLIFDDDKRSVEYRKLREDFGESYLDVKETKVLISPQEKAMVMAVRQHGTKTSGLDFSVNFTVSFEDGASFSDKDRYIFNPKSAGLSEEDLMPIPK